MPTSTEWLQHFEHNRGALLAIPWERGAELSDRERSALGRSIAEFQRGESSEGRHLVRYAQEYSRRTGDADYARAIPLFIAEEQRHARDLARFLGLNGIPPARGSLVDGVFRRLRNLIGTLEVSIGVLILAEIIAQVYYDVLRESTGSLILGRLCDQIVRDEAAHVRFQAEQLGRLRARRGPAGYALTMLGQRVVFLGTCLVVYAGHRRALRLGHCGPGRFWSDAWRYFNRAFAISRGARSAGRAASLERDDRGRMLAVPFSHRR